MVFLKRLCEDVCMRAHTCASDYDWGRGSARDVAGRVEDVAHSESSGTHVDAMVAAVISYCIAVKLRSKGGPDFSTRAIALCICGGLDFQHLTHSRHCSTVAQSI